MSMYWRPVTIKKGKPEAVLHCSVKAAEVFFDPARIDARRAPPENPAGPIAARLGELASVKQSMINYPPDCAGCKDVEEVIKGRLAWKCKRYHSPCARRARWAAWRNLGKWNGSGSEVACHVWITKKWLSEVKPDDPRYAKWKAKLAEYVIDRSGNDGD